MKVVKTCLTAACDSAVCSFTAAGAAGAIAESPSQVVGRPDSSTFWASICLQNSEVL